MYDDVRVGLDELPVDGDAWPVEDSTGRTSARGRRLGLR
jgi:hypothetical protein